MSIAKRFVALFKRQKGSPGDKKEAVHGKPAPQPADGKSSASAKDEKLSTESKRSIGAKDSVDGKPAPEKTRALGKDPEQIDDPTKNPWPALCYLDITLGAESPNQSSKTPVRGSGFFINETTVITCAHNLFQYNRKTRERLTPTSISIRASNSETAVPVKVFPLSTRFSKQYEKCLLDGAGSERDHYDFGAIFLLPGEITPHPTFYFDIQGVEIDDPRWEQPLKCGGYTQANPGTGSPFDLYSMQGMASSKANGRFVGSANNLVKHHAEARPGQSGGPLFAADDNRVVGIQVSALAGSLDTFGAVRMTGEMIQLFKSWEREYQETAEFRKNRKDREDLIA